MKKVLIREGKVRKVFSRLIKNREAERVKQDARRFDGSESDQVYFSHDVNPATQWGPR